MLIYILLLKMRF